MSIPDIPKVIVCAGLACLLNGFVWAANYDRDPIVETQSTAVPVTPETLKDERPGAPAPSFQMIEKSSKFLTAKSAQELDDEMAGKSVLEPSKHELPSDWGEEEIVPREPEGSENLQSHQENDSYKSFRMN